jgi:very-short-patch-repair endonuclease/DNA polymerase III delta prime subunit
MSSLLSKLDQTRKELLDFSGRNRLTNYRRNAPKYGGITILDELPDQIFKTLVTEGRAMTFLATTENVAGRPTLLLPLVGETNSETEANEQLPGRYTDTKLQTSLTLEDLDRRLRRIYTTARTFIEEQGINALYLAIGMLQWYESDTSLEQHEAPLVLIPVELYRDNVRTRYKLRYTGDEIGSNISLQERLLREFSIQLPGPEDDIFDIHSYFGTVEQAISSRPRWIVDRSAIVLDFFRFNKLQMYKDLDVSSWMDVTGITEHPVLSKLLGNFSFLAETLSYEDSVSNSSSQLNTESSSYVKNLVLDADTSQVQAVQAAMSGRNLVIQGPPGTGKSQTITNIIGEAVGQGKTVLFVAEKMAALEVVKRRLDKIGLGDACLELHSHKANKKSFLAELDRILQLGEPRTPNQEHNLRTLQEERDYLDRYCNAVNTEIEETGITLFHAYGLYLQADKRLKETVSPQLQLPNIETWKESDFLYRLEVLERFQSLLRRIGQPNRHPFWGSQRKIYLPADQQILRDLCVAAERCISQLRQDADSAAELFGMSFVEQRGNTEKLLQVLELALAAPRVVEVSLEAPEWKSAIDVILPAIEQAEERDKYRKQFEEYLIPEAWRENFVSVRKAIVSHGERISRFWSRDYRQAQQLLKSVSRRDLPKNTNELVKLVDAVLEMQRLQSAFENSQPMLQRIFRDYLRDRDTPWSEFREIAMWMKRVYSSGLDEKFVQPLLTFVHAYPEKDKVRTCEFNLRRSLLEYINTISAVIELTQLNEQVRFGSDRRLFDLTFLDQTQLLHEWAIRADQLQEMVNFNDVTNSLHAHQLTPVLVVAENWENASSHLVDLVKKTRYTALIERAMREQSVLASFNGATHQHRITRFRELDKLLLQHNRTTVLHRHWCNLPRYHAGGLALLHEQFNRKRGHKSIRTLMGEAGTTVQAIKPVFMMSPFSIATFLPPSSVHFDLVIFDEASQVKPVDAFGAILRGKQTVVVGDDKQLPPTNFFNKVLDSESDDDNVATDTESILGLFRAKASHTEMLKWHYRSRHESLIAVSNYEFYNDQLIVFPSPDKARTQLGLVFHHLPETVYVPGTGQTGVSHIGGSGGGYNDGEAQAVAKAVMQHAQKHPEKTLLVATFNQRQHELIDDHLERLRRADSSCEDFFTKHPEEPFAIKNLENVQGDERDVIFISVGFGKDKANKLSMNFGPLNVGGGERRLNVLITRARERCEVFTNLTADDIDLGRTQSKGVRALKRFLKYAATGVLDVPEVTGREAESPFEQAVVEALRSLGYRVETQVGTGGYRIDMAVVDQDQPGRYILGIECDGATYHRAQSARDRDRLRQEVLESMGWQIHRIWSTDWFRNPLRELQRVKESIEAARVKAAVYVSLNTQSEQHQEVTGREVISYHAEIHVSSRPTLLKYEVAQPNFQLGTENLHQIALDKLASEIVRIVRIESPIHIEELLQRIGRRISKGVREKIELAVREAISKNQLLRKGEFLLNPSAAKVPVRDRSNLSGSSRKIEYIYYDELALAVRTVVKHAIGITKAELAKETLRLLGYSRITEDMIEEVNKVIESMQKQSNLEMRGNFVYISERELS